MRRALVLSILASGASACAGTTVVERPDEPVLIIVGAPPALPPVPKPPPPPPAPPPKFELQADQILLLEPITFGDQTSEIDEVSEGLIEELAEFLDENPHLLKISIEVHTDMVGSARANKKLAKQRAEAVRTALVERDISKERLGIKAWGEERPIAAEETDDANDLNRRVELIIVEREAPDPEASPAREGSQP